MNYKFLNSKQVKELKKKLEDQFGFNNPLDYAFLINEKNKVFIINKEVDKIDLSKIRINSLGMYFCEDRVDGIRMSIEGSQLIGPNAKKKIVELDAKDARLWLKGEDIPMEGSDETFVIVRSGSDFMGCAKHKDDILFNYVPKERRIKSSD